MSFQYLFTPIKVGNTELTNRIVYSPHMNFPRGSDQEIGYLSARIKGGAGTVVLYTTRGTRKEDEGWTPVSNVLTEEGIAENKRTCDAIHAIGGKVLIELNWQAGYDTFKQPSSQMPWQTGTYRSATTAELDETVEEYAQSILGAKKAGADGVEIYCSCGVSLQLLIDPLFNKRTDKYGGPLENRMRALLDLLEKGRELVGPDFIIAVAIDVDEEFLGGIALDEGVEACRMISDGGNADLLIIDAQNVKVQEGHLHYPSSYLPQAFTSYAYAAVREAVDIPVFGSHHINTCELAEQLIAEGQCDGVWMCRPLIADPELPNKAKRGENDEIRACIGDCEGCYGHFWAGLGLGCSVNPDVGKEYLGDPYTPAEAKKKVLVVGGGLAGMETALTAARRGHEVTLVERDDKLGGFVKLEAALPGLGDRQDIIRWYELQLGKAGVDVQLETEATPEFVRGFGADSVVIATGANYSELGISEHYLMPIPGHDADYVLTPEDIVAGEKPVGDHVVVYDTTNYLVGPGIAEMLADQGKEVDFITYDSQVAREVEICYVDRACAMRVLPKVHQIINSAILGIEDNAVQIRNRFTLEEEEIEDVDTVVLVTSRPPNEDLFLTLKEDDDSVQAVGDVAISRYGLYQMYYATQAGRAMGQSL